MEHTGVDFPADYESHAAYPCPYDGAVLCAVVDYFRIAIFYLLAWCWVPRLSQD